MTRIADARLTVEQQQLVADTFPAMIKLIAIFTHKRNIPIRLLDQLESAGAEGLCEAATRFDPAIAAWQTFWPHRVRGAVKDELRRLGAAGFGGAPRDCGVPVGSLSDPPQHGQLPNNNRPVCVGDLIAADPDTVDASWQAEYVDEARKLARLAGPKPRVQHAVEALLLGCESPTMKTAAATVGMVESRLSQILTGLRSLLQEHPYYARTARRIAGTARTTVHGVRRNQHTH